MRGHNPCRIVGQTAPCGPVNVQHLLAPYTIGAHLGATQLFAEHVDAREAPFHCMPTAAGDEGIAYASEVHRVALAVIQVLRHVSVLSRLGLGASGAQAATLVTGLG